MKPQGQSGSIIDNLLRRERTESERIQGDDWTQSPKPMKLTPVFKERSTKETSSRKKDKKSKNTQRKSSNSKAQKDEYERDSTTTPDSVKDNQNSRPSPPKERRKKKRSGKKGRKASDKQNSSSNTNEELLEGTSSDSGTATDDTVNYMEISGFPPEMIGALIGKKGKNIQNIQTQSRCKILVKDYPVENGGQYIAIEGSRNNINKALKILREKFPDIKLSHLETFTGPAAETPTEPQNGVEPLQYDYDSYYSGSINNTSDTLELVEGVPVEVRVTSMGLTFNELWLQPYTHPSKDLFDRLETNMSDFYNRDTQLSVLESYLELGAYAMCLHHSPDELTGKELPKWYRVQVVQYPDDHHAMVLFLDFGGYASVPIEMLRKIMHEFLPGPSNVPFQAVHAELAGLQVLPNEQDKLPDIAMKLHDIICKVPRNSLEAQVVRYDFEKDQPLVKLFYQQNGQRIMVNEVFAQHCSHIEFKEI